MHVLSSDALWLLGVTAAVIATLAYVPYLKDTLAGRTQPQRASWFIWSVLSSLAFLSQIHEGATASLWFAGAQCGATVVILLASVRYGVGGLVNRRDCMLLTIAAGGLALWALTDTAAYALAVTIGVSLVGGIATIEKAYIAPESETMATWVLSSLAALCALISVGRLDPVLLAYPVYLLVLKGAVITAIVIGRERLATSPVRIYVK
ncbi:MAG: hypothetical protein AAGP08_10435 [Pseudomonadota bacterium]